MKIEHNFTINLGYSVFFEKNIFEMPIKPFWNEIFKEKESKVTIFIDQAVQDTHEDLVKNLETWAENCAGIESKPALFFVPGGEQVKQNFAFIETMINNLLEAKMCRHSYVLIIGGGAVLDAVGFAASITHRGIRQVRIPTTVLSQDDSAMGVKNGVNYAGLKNLLGTFVSPYAVVCDSNFLTTLSDADWIAGVSEAFKVGIIKDINLLNYLCEYASEIPKRNMQVMQYIVQESAKIHFDHIALNNDPFETGSSRPLDFGHWSAHKLESMTEGRLSHGYAVAIGICLDLCCAVELGLILESEVKRVIDAMKRAHLPTYNELLNLEEGGELVIYQGIEKFREHIGGTLNLTMPNSLGSRIEIDQLPEKIVRNAVKRLQLFESK